MTEAIKYFRGQHSFLSNFHAYPVADRGEAWPTLEHAYQAAKTDDPEWLARIREARTPGDAKRRGRTVKLRRCWDGMRDRVMLRLLRAKFSGTLGALLLATGEAYLEEGNDWHDTYWGVCDGGCRMGPHRPRGKNKLGVLLMTVRAELRQRHFGNTGGRHADQGGS